MLKFGRNYILTLDIEVDELVFTPPLTLEFDITRNILTSANVCSIRLYNLSANHRNQLRFNAQDTLTFKAIKLQAGYGTTNLPTIFQGNVTQAWSVREGVNFITTLECFDGGFAFANGMTNTTFPENTPKEDMLSTLAESLPNTTLGAIGTFPGQSSRANAFVGNTADILRTESGGAMFIDGGQVHILNDNEYVDDGQIVTINSASGLLNTPLREVSNLSFDIIFAPEVKPGRLIMLESSTVPDFNGLKKVTAVKHRGVISAAVCGDATTSVETFFNQDYVAVEAQT